MKIYVYQGLEFLFPCIVSVHCKVEVKPIPVFRSSPNTKCGCWLFLIIFGVCL